MRKYTDEEILVIAQKYTTKSEWVNADGGSYRSAIRRADKSLFKKCTAHMQKRTAPNKKWTKESLTEIMSQYSSTEEWRNADRTSYRAAIKLGFSKELFLSIKSSRKPRGYWTKEKCAEAISSCSSRAEFEKVHPGAYDVIHANKWQDLLSSLAYISHPGRWSNQNDIRKEALKYRSISEWQKASYQSYIKAKDFGVFDECTSHMASRGSVSLPELDIMDLVKGYFPKAHKTVIGSRKPGSIGQCFELDIYIPELRKGIEFNGDYWHSFAGLKKTRPSWPNEMIENYHQIKKDFFLKRGIEYIDIWENEWKESKEQCISRIKGFLGIL